MQLKLSVLLILLFLLVSCRSAEYPQTPMESLQIYLQAFKKKDVSKMKALISKGSIQMAQDEAKAQNVTVDEILLRETIFSPDQKTLKVRNEKIDGDSATIEVETMPEVFDRVPFVKEEGIWKIAKEKIAEEIQKQSDEEMKKLDEKINQERQEN